MADLGGWGGLVAGIGTVGLAGAALLELRRRPKVDATDDLDDVIKDRDYWHDRARECEMSTGHVPSEPRRRKQRRR